MFLSNHDEVQTFIKHLLIGNSFVKFKQWYC